ncbi:hypothetical protein ACRAWG_11310 [Methylobacterium sp. P31]
MSDPEPDWAFRERLHRVVTEADRDLVTEAEGEQLDAPARKYDLYRTGVPLRGFDGFNEDGSEEDSS